MSDQRNVGVIGDRGSISREKIWGFGDWFPTKMCGSINFGQMMVISAFLRLGLIAYGEWQDAHMEVRYTDIDYFVFSDAAALVASGKSPFERSTYRYSPLLAFLLIPNSILHQSWGKLLFSSADLLVGLFVDIILKLRSVPETLRLLSVAVWLFNPFTFTIGTRGNCEPIVCAMILWIIICIMNGKVIQAAFWYGLVVHFRIYPIIYALPFVLVLNNQHARPGECILKKGSFRSGVTDPSSRARVVEPSTTSWKQLFCPWVLLRSNITINSFLFGLISGSIFFFCTALFFKLYGWEFLNEGLLYHLTRTDPRHNFSIYFYHIYLHHQHKLSLVEKLISFLPQLMVQLALIFRFAADLPFCLFLQTVAFVAFNKVITAQYFVWFFCLLPLILPWSSMKLKWKGLICISLWMGSQLHWLLWGYILEFKGWNVFIQLWLASILFLAANTVILLMLVNVEEERRERSRKAKERRKEKWRSSPSDDPKPELDEPESVLRLILDRYPDVASDLRKLLEMLDNGQGVDLRGISDKSLVKLLKKLFQSLNLDQNEKGVFLLPPLSVPTLEVIGSTLRSYLKPKDNNEFLNSGSPNEQAKVDDKEVVDAPVLVDEPKEKDSAPSRRRVIGPEMPSRELLAAAAELTQAEATLREAEVEVDNDLFIGPPPPAIVAEAESANEAERFEEVSRIAGAEVDKPYDVLAVNWKMSFDNIKKRYWKLSLMVHPDKCSHPQAHQAFVILNQAFKDLQDPDKRKAIDEKIKLKEEKEQFEAELKELREAARWRQSQGISLEGDEELLAVVKEAPKRDEWMTTLPPERKPGMAPRQSTSFSKTGKEGRGDTSVWTDSPSDRAEKAKLNYLEAYNKAKAISDIDGENSKRSSNASLVDEYNASKRSVSLLHKHQEKGKHPKKKSKQPEKEEWVGAHPWKPWDRETDLSAGRKKVDLDSKSMGQGLTSRFSSGPTQRNFL